MRVGGLRRAEVVTEVGRLVVDDVLREGDPDDPPRVVWDDTAESPDAAGKPMGSLFR
ncbi:hypothetical protein Hsar01_01538 [Haloferula sargassicola]|uniref:Uncharacterized protein n=1 Tax=Haloferula sargassicola TaxID=490096 RepID=A0ABP9UM60_9BACT